MDIKRIIVRDYLESLTESKELDHIFPILLESQGFILCAKPTEYIGSSQYGKDVVAIGKDFKDGIKKRFYFELKGGADRHITPATYPKPDGIRESLIEAKDAKFQFENKDYEKLPLKIVLVHNGELKSTVEKTFKDFIEKEFPEGGSIEFERWGISELTNLFSEKLFGAYLLTDSTSIKLFNKVLIDLDTSDGISIHFEDMLDTMFSKIDRDDYSKTIPRKWIVLFESINLISFIIYQESKKYNNIEIAKKYQIRLFMKFIHWVLVCKLERDQEILKYITKSFISLFTILEEYFRRTLPIANQKHGLYYERGGTYEDIGYTLRTFNYLQYLILYLKFRKLSGKDSSEILKSILINVLEQNSVSIRPILDIHSIPIIDILNFFIELDDKESAQNYLSSVLYRIKYNKEALDRMPDARNNVTNIIKYYITGDKPLGYVDSTSPLLAALMEYTAILDMENEYIVMRDFIIDQNIELGLFVPHHGKDSKSKHLIENKELDLEELLFSEYFFNEGYQTSILLTKDFSDKLTFKEFKESIIQRKDEFTYDYRIDTIEPFFRDLAHIYFKTPYFPDRWRQYLE